MPRFLILIRSPPPSHVLSMVKYHATLQHASILLSSEGLHPSTRDAYRITFSGSDSSLENHHRRNTKHDPEVDETPPPISAVTKGPFAHEQLVSGFWVVRARDVDEALGWAKRAPMRRGEELEVRRVWEGEEVGREVEPKMGGVEGLVGDKHGGGRGHGERRHSDGRKSKGSDSSGRGSTERRREYVYEDEGRLERKHRDSIEEKDDARILDKREHKHHGKARDMFQEGERKIREYTGHPDGGDRTADSRDGDYTELAPQDSRSNIDPRDRNDHAKGNRTEIEIDARNRNDTRAQSSRDVEDGRHRRDSENAEDRDEKRSPRSHEHKHHRRESNDRSDTRDDGAPDRRHSKDDQDYDDARVRHSRDLGDDRYSKESEKSRDDQPPRDIISDSNRTRHRRRHVTDHDDDREHGARDQRSLEDVRAPDNGTKKPRDFEDDRYSRGIENPKGYDKPRHSRDSDHTHDRGEGRDHIDPRDERGDDRRSTRDVDDRRYSGDSEDIDDDAVAADEREHGSERKDRRKHRHRRKHRDREEDRDRKK